MSFQKKGEYLWKPEGDVALDSKPLCLKMDSTLKAKLRAIPNWQHKLRTVLPELIEQWNQEISNSNPPNIPH